MFTLPAGLSSIKLQPKAFVKTMIKARLLKLKTKLQTKKLQYELEQLERKRDKAYELHLQMLHRTEQLLSSSSALYSDNQVAEPQAFVQVSKQQQQQASEREEEEDCCCCCCCCYGCYDLDEQNLANENLENHLGAAINTTTTNQRQLPFEYIC